MIINHMFNSSRLYPRFQWAVNSCQRRSLGALHNFPSAASTPTPTPWLHLTLTFALGGLAAVSTTVFLSRRQLAAHIQLSRVRNVVELQTLAVKSKFLGPLSRSSSISNICTYVSMCNFCSCSCRYGTNENRKMLAMISEVLCDVRVRANKQHHRHRLRYLINIK